MSEPAFHSDRIDASQLPKIREIEALIEREARRPVPPGKTSQHYADFSLVRRWLDLLSLSREAFDDRLVWQDAATLGLQLSSEVMKRTLEKVEGGNKEMVALAQEISMYLGERDKPQISDAIFVFGGNSMERIETAVTLYKREIAQRIFISGGMPIYAHRTETEAQVYKRWAMEHDVPEEAIFLHETPISVSDNVQGGLNEMDAQGLPYGSLTLVTGWYAMRRSWAHMMKFVPEQTVLYRDTGPASGEGDYDDNQWWKNPKGIPVVFNEFAKMRIAQTLNLC